ncbi:hypothetical protein [Teichococcus vastitatis]|uniref:Uncharacterized protein n=1 Tax=Teichococcus vastitatis TaxID=2307076 RepID=A0ABS9WDU8_9PROT|nr:hypothetical protein [Pseudoroseomonas vastitatis]MCI0756915.1 hypothetical protein [Pseudoroseomonas vastitatis]
MTPDDNLRVLRQQVRAARREHIAGALGQVPADPSQDRLPRVQRMLANLDQALHLPQPAHKTTGQPQG